MNTAADSRQALSPEFRDGQSTRKWVSRGAWVLLGLVLGVAAHSLWSHRQAATRVQGAQAKAAALWAAVTPEAEARLKQVARHLQDLRDDLDQASLAGRSDLIELARYRVAQKRLQLQLEEVNSQLQRLAAFQEQSPRWFGLPPGQEVLPKDLSAKLGELKDRAAQLKQELELSTPAFEVVRDRRTQLAAVETEAALRVQAAAEAQERERIEAQRQSQTAVLAQSSAPTWQGGTPPEPWTPGPAWAQAETASSLPSNPLRPPVRYVLAPPVRSPNLLVIGSSYPDRFIGYRNYSRWAPYPFIVVRQPPIPMGSW